MITKDIETPINNAPFLSRLHGFHTSFSDGGRIFGKPLTACSQTVPGGLDVVRDPLVDGLVVFLAVLDVLVNLAGVVGLPRPMEEL
jgi:hypothetical protein